MATADDILAQAAARFSKTVARGISHGDKRLDLASAKEIRDRISLIREADLSDDDEILSGEVATL
jgi:hypothetical protein